MRVHREHGVPTRFLPLRLQERLLLPRHRSRGQILQRHLPRGAIRRQDFGEGERVRPADLPAVRGGLRGVRGREILPLPLQLAAQNNLPRHPVPHHRRHGAALRFHHPVQRRKGK